MQHDIVSPNVFAAAKAKSTNMTWDRNWKVQQVEIIFICTSQSRKKTKNWTKWSFVYVDICELVII